MNEIHLFILIVVAIAVFLLGGFLHKRLEMIEDQITWFKDDYDRHNQFFDRMANDISRAAPKFVQRGNDVKH